MDLMIKEIFDKLQDDESRMIFIHRLLYYLDENDKHLFDMLEDLNAFGTIPAWGDVSGCRPWSDIFNLIKTSRKPVIAYGAGSMAKTMLMLTEKFGGRLACICDSNNAFEGTIRYGYRVISPQTLIREYKDANIIVFTGPSFAPEIFKKLLDLGFASSQIFSPVQVICSEMYFGPDFINISPDEVYIDVGCHDGETIMRFVSCCGGNYDKIYGMEPDPVNLKKVQHEIEKNNLKNVTLIRKGAWSDERILSFSDNLGSGSHISDEGNIKIPVAAIDDLLGEEKTSFIKMDIEGAELEALRGAAKTIARNKPKLAISVYHKPEDILELPVYINSLVPDYKYYMRHHKPFFYDTVFYAIPQ